jgi:hypothetical protein
VGAGGIAGAEITAEGGVAVDGGVACVDRCLSHWLRKKAAEPSTAALLAIRVPNRASVATHPLSLLGRLQSVVFGPRAQLPPRRFK